MKFLCVLVLCAILQLSVSHSIMLDPFPVSPKYCGIHKTLTRLKFPGPCFVDELTGGKGFLKKASRSKLYPQIKPYKVYRRVEKAKVRYTRINHAAGGFNRFTLIPYTTEKIPGSNFELTVAKPAKSLVVLAVF